MPIVKSDLIKELADAYPNFLRKDLTRLLDIALYEMINSFYLHYFLFQHDKRKSLEDIKDRPSMI